MRQRTVLALANLADTCFAYTTFDRPSGMRPSHHERVDLFSEFLFEKEFFQEIVEAAGRLPAERNAVKTFILELWKSLAIGTSAREQLFEKLAGDLLEYAHRPQGEILVHVRTDRLVAAMRELALDGYDWRDGSLRKREENVLDVADEESALVELYRQLELAELDQMKHDLKLTDEHYVGGRWGDCIKHARDVLEKVLLNAARKRGALDDQLRQPRNVRDWLRDNAVLSEVEHRFVSALYGWLSEDGGHPNMSSAESARILRQLALSEAHFVLLRVQALETSAAL